MTQCIKTGVDQITSDSGKYNLVPRAREVNSILWVGPEPVLERVRPQKGVRVSVQEETDLVSEKPVKSLAGGDGITGMRLCLAFTWVWGIQT